MAWSEEQRAEALRIAERHGSAEASRRTGLPQGTIRRLRHDRNRSGPPTGVPASDWAARKDAAARDSFATAQAALRKVKELLSEGRIGDAQRASLTFAILADKSAVLELGAAAAQTRVINGEPVLEALPGVPDDATRLAEVAKILKEIGVLGDDGEDHRGPGDLPRLLPAGPPPHPDGADDDYSAPDVETWAPQRVVRTIISERSVAEVPEHAWRPIPLSGG